MNCHASIAIPDTTTQVWMSDIKQRTTFANFVSYFLSFTPIFWECICTNWLRCSLYTWSLFIASTLHFIPYMYLATSKMHMSIVQGVQEAVWMFLIVFLYQTLTATLLLCSFLQCCPYSWVLLFNWLAGAQGLALRCLANLEIFIHGTTLAQGECHKKGSAHRPP
jgi:hypothetical protein